MDVVDPINERQVPTQPMVKDHDSSMSYMADHLGIMSYEIDSNDPAYRQSANRLNTTAKRKKKREILHIDYCRPMRLVEFREKIFSQKEFHHGIDTYVVRTSNLYLNKHAIHVGIFFFHILKNIYIFVLRGI